MNDTIPTGPTIAVIGNKTFIVVEIDHANSRIVIQNRIGIYPKLFEKIRIAHVPEIGDRHRVSTIMEHSETTTVIFEPIPQQQMTQKDQNDLRQLLTLFSHELHANSRAKGWWADREELSKTPAGHVAVDIGCLALAGTELSEAIEATRVPCQDDHIPFFTGQEAEIADTIIRLLDFAAARNLKVIDALFAKAEYNKGRSVRHGGKLA